MVQTDSSVQFHLGEEGWDGFTREIVGRVGRRPILRADLDDLDTIYTDLPQEKRKELLVIARALLEAERS